MSVSQLRTLENNLDELLKWSGGKVAKEKLAVATYELYSSMGAQAVSKEYEDVYELSEMSKHIFKAAIQEIGENEEKWEKSQLKENKGISKLKTTIFELSVVHMKQCCRNAIDHNDVPFIQYSLACLRRPYIQSDVGMESDISGCLSNCANKSQLHWAQHSHVQHVWELIWRRIETPRLDYNVMKNYVDVAVKIMKAVEISVYEDSPYDLVKTVIFALRKAAQNCGSNSSMSTRKYPYVFVLSYVVHRWGIDARDLILNHIFELMQNLIPLISIEKTGLQEDSKICMMLLIDDLVKLAMVEGIGKHRTITEKAESNLKELVKLAVTESLKSAHRIYSYKLAYSLPEEYVEYLARWLLVLRELDPPSADNSFDEQKEHKKRDDSRTFSLEGLVDLSFGQHIIPLANKCNAWDGILQILEKIVASRKLDGAEVGRIVAVLWAKRKAFCSDALRSTFCSLLQTVISREDVQFGIKQVPSIDVILKYSLSLMPNLTSVPKSAFLAECIVRHRSRDVPKEMLRVIFDTVSRTNPTSIAVLRLLSALVSYTEFDESSRFCNINDDEKRSWSLRKDIVDWLLQDPGANSHALIFQLCQYHPVFCYDMEQPICEDALLRNLQLCHLVSPSVEHNGIQFRPLEAGIDEMIEYVRDELHCKLVSEFSLPLFVITYQFFLKTQLEIPDFESHTARIAQETQGLDDLEFLDSVQNFTVWPEKLQLPSSRNSLECLIVYFLANIENQLLNLNPWLNRKEKIVTVLAKKAKRSATLRSKLQHAMPFNNFVKKVITDNIGDLYETIRKFDDFAFLLSHRNMMSTIEVIRKEGREQVETGGNIGEADMVLFEKEVNSTCISNVSPANRIRGYELNPSLVAIHPDHVYFDDRSVLQYLKQLRKSPFLAQNIVRYIILHKKMWHLHGIVLEYVVRHERLLATCIATIPDMIRFLKIYQVLFDPKSQSVQFLGMDTDSMSTCKKFMRKPRGTSLTPDELIILFGYPQNKWAKTIVRFWRLFEREPAIICEKLHRFAEECVRLGLTHRLAYLLKAISTSEFSRKVLSDNHLRTVYWLTYRSIFSKIVKKKCSTEIVEMCCDVKLRYDLFEHRIKKIPAPHADNFIRFETEIAFSVEKFLQNGIESDDVNYTDFGLVEFYRQLNENLTEEIIKTSESRENYLIDFFTAIWLLHPAMRPQILQIIARFKHISPAWTQFPQPPHVVATENTFLWKLRFTIAMNIQNNKRWKEGELSTYIMVLLTSFNTCHYREHLIPEHHLTRLKNETRRDALCILSRILKKDAISENEEVMDPTIFEAITRSVSLFPNIAACVVPFLFKLCRDVTMKYDDAFCALMACLKGVDKENQQIAYCLAESFDSLGLDLISRYEKVNDESNPNFSSHWQFVLAKLFVKHGFLNHAFSLANIFFDRFGSPLRNVMMINRVPLENIENSDALVELLVEIYVAENNSVALSTLPPNVQTRPEVRQVMHKRSKEWLRLVAEGVQDKQELTVIRWMCGLQSEDGEQFLDSILRCRFTEYPKIIDSPFKFVYFLLYHLAIGTDISTVIGDTMSKISGNLSIDEVRLLLLATDAANFEPNSVVEHVIQAVRDLRETTGRRKRFEMNHVREVNEKTARIVHLAGILTENNAHGAASNLLKSWHEECVAWNSPSVDVTLVEICQCDVMCQAGDTRMAEIQLRAIPPRVSSMSDVEIAEWTLVLSKITLEYRNDLEEGVRLLEKGCKRLQKSDSVEARLKVLLKFHSICINQLSKLEEYRESRSFRMKQKAISVFEQQINNSSRLVRGNSADEGSKRTVTRVRREHQCEKDDVEKVENSVTTAVQKAVSSAFDALDCISQLDDDDEAIRTASLIIFPLIDVIYKYEQCPEVVSLLKDHANTKVTSRLWLCATSHIASKCFSVEPSPLRRYLYQILCRLIFDYPYHVLHTVLMYEYEQNGAQVKSFLTSIFEKNAKRDISKLKEIVVSMRDAHSAYRELARMNAKEGRFQRVQVDGKQMLRMPSELKIFKCKLSQLPIPIITQKIGRPGDYTTDGLITWKSWKGVFSIADGLSAPKIWEVEGSNGKWYKTVWKLDDVRQDVLVEQMFDVTNNMLEKRMLRTYNVVPLDTDCGIIEFCGGTISIKEMLCGASRDQGLHQEYNPEEVSASKISLEMRNCQNESTETRRRVFVDICKSYSPVFRHFFYRNFPTAHIWREKINEYRRSLATWSVVCYIVGLGDRHASNILFDQKMCTFVHIDLGMILEYSKRTLPVPEQVPFRISRDLLDPILIEGIENGQLADDCTNAIEKLKQNGKVILGVASALLRETMTNFREAEQACGRPSYISEMAIGRLRDKLEGTDDGVTAQSSNLQVRRLLREATSADNLSRMFCGWMPYL